MSKPAKFPGTIWDGSSASRPNPAPESGQSALDVYREADAADYQQLLAEVIAIENALATTTTTAAANSASLVTNTASIAAHTSALAREQLLSGSINTAAIATGATSGFMYLLTVGGTPTGVPTGVPNGFLAAVYDTVAHKIWVYDGAWKSTAALV